MHTVLTLLHKEWTEIEKYQLWIIGHLNVPLETASRLFHRSPNAICKAMARYRIRPSGSVRPGPKRTLRAAMGTALYELDNLFDDLEKTSSSAVKATEQIRRAELPQSLQFHLERCGLTHTPPWIMKPLPRDANNPEMIAHSIMASRVDAPRANEPFPWQTREELKERKRLAKTLLWVCLEDIIESLRQEGMEVIKLTLEPFPPYKGNYRLNGRYVTSAQLVIEANKKRLEKGLEPLLVCEVTE